MTTKTSVIMIMLSKHNLLLTRKRMEEGVVFPIKNDNIEYILDEFI